MAKEWVWAPNVQYGKTNKSIKIIQKHLGVQQTGFYGEITEAAVAAYQRSLGLKGDDADGRFGPWSLRKLAEDKGFEVRGLVNPVRKAIAVAVGRVALPVKGGAYVSLAYGVRRPHYAAGFHTGRDYAAPAGRDLLAVRAGTVRFFWGGAYGNVALLAADNGRDYWYCHMSRSGKGGRVKAGDVIGYLGSSGNSTGPHLHLEDRPRGGGYGNVRNPLW